MPRKINCRDNYSAVVAKARTHFVRCFIAETRRTVSSMSGMTSITEWEKTIETALDVMKGVFPKHSIDTGDRKAVDAVRSVRSRDRKCVHLKSSFRCTWRKTTPTHNINCKPVVGRLGCLKQKLVCDIATVSSILRSAKTVSDRVVSALIIILEEALGEIKAMK
jgi:hypothetical protein